MQVKIFTIPVLGGEAQLDAMNVFLRSKKVLGLDKELVDTSFGTFWCFCVTYLDSLEAAERERPRVDYKKILPEAAYERFVRMRELRKRLAQEEGVPSYVIFTDEEMATLAQMESPELSAMKSVRGIGEKKVEKYGAAFLQILNDEPAGKPD